MAVKFCTASTSLVMNLEKDGENQLDGQEDKCCSALNC